MAVCGLRTVLLIVCILELIITIQRQIFDFLGYMWLPIIANFINILLIIFGCFGAVQYVTKYLLSYAIWSVMWLTWNIFLICYYLNLGTLNRESGLLSLGTGSVSWWEGNGWGCQSVWGEVDGPGSWRPTRVEGCLVQWHYIELGQSALAAFLTLMALPLTIVSTHRSFNRKKSTDNKGTLPRRPVYTIELKPTEVACESSLKPMTPRRVKRRSGSRGGSSRRSRRSHRTSAYHASTSSLPRDPRLSRPTSAHSSYSNFHAARPASYHAAADTLSKAPRALPQDVPEPPPPAETVPIMTKGYENSRWHDMSPGYDVVGPYHEPAYHNVGYEARNRGYEHEDGRFESPPYEGEGWKAPPPPAPPYSARATPLAPGPPAYDFNVYSD
ncbi:hypothetical protein JYU34_003775 [Plutella xylostella]|uniref:Uncharacterized protein n=2 Tax=Plutella xylostella TaxID=51655 RepID=A0ABQ7R0X7_PLUXY|nr:sodium/potassium-transporting ATPase subunit beta-1-interacting protein 4 [Plutella xylostella]KAG7310935.1 hypothetical protein JYU34_003775 [Plutella xylostella]CAG9132336.1 unnamed protein product [Plutella xylostella]